MRASRNHRIDLAMTSLPSISQLLSALSFDLLDGAKVRAGTNTAKTVWSLHSVITDPAAAPDEVKTAKRLLLRLLKMGRDSFLHEAIAMARPASTPAAVTGLARSGVIRARATRRGAFVSRITRACTPITRKARARSSAIRSWPEESDLRRGPVTSRHERANLHIHSALHLTSA